MNNSIDFKTTNYFSGMPYLLGFILTPIGLVLLLSPQHIVGAILLAAGITILTTHYRLQINYTKKSYIEYISILGIKAGQEKNNFSEIRYLFIKKIKVSQTLNSRASSTTIEKFQYDGFLKFSEENKLHLMTLGSKKNLQRRLDDIAAKLKCKVIDYSNENSPERI